MKLALIHPQIIRGSGVENYLIEFAKRLSASGHELTYITSLTTPEIGATLPGRWELQPRIRGSATMRMWHFNRLAPRAVGDADLSIAFGRTCMQDIHRNGTGCHRIYGNLLPLWQRLSVKHLYELHLERRLYTRRETKQFISSSARVAAQLQGVYGSDGERHRIISPPVETHLFKPAENRANTREIICRKLQTDAAKPVLIFVSLSHRRRGLEPLLEALARIDATLWIVGKSLSPTLRDKINHLGVASRIRAVPVTSDLVELYQSADWFVHPTQYDAFSNTVLQSMACGLPGIVSVMDGAVDHVRNGENGLMLYHPQQPKELAARIQEALAYDATTWQVLSTAARETVQALTWDRHMQEWTEVLEGT
ncbi:glycosyltransferase family 4 protein [Prosthecobacter sp.]|uniref:glycosyltransferase family 4 protein n=1 Tax=Prosthecobacter sp. TaxID=1965333 RepID=UPI003784A3B6